MWNMKSSSLLFAIVVLGVSFLLGGVVVAPRVEAINHFLETVRALGNAPDGARRQADFLGTHGFSPAAQQLIVQASASAAKGHAALQASLVQIAGSSAADSAKAQQMEDVYRQRTNLINQTYASLISGLAADQAAILDSYIAKRSSLPGRAAKASN